MANHYIDFFLNFDFDYYFDYDFYFYVWTNRNSVISYDGSDFIVVNLNDDFLLVNVNYVEMVEISNVFILLLQANVFYFVYIYHLDVHFYSNSYLWINFRIINHENYVDFINDDVVEKKDFEKVISKVDLKVLVLMRVVKIFYQMVNDFVYLNLVFLYGFNNYYNFSICSGL